MNFLREWKYSTILAVSGGACALWWLVNKLPSKNNDNNNANNNYCIEHVGDFESITKRRNEVIPDLMNRLAEKHGEVFTITIHSEQVLIVSSRVMIRLVGVAKQAKILKDFSNTCSLLRKFHKNNVCNKDENDPSSKFSEQCQHAIERYGSDYNFTMSLLLEVEKLVEVFRTYESSKVYIDPCKYINYATTNVINCLLFGCRYTYNSRRLQNLVDIINVNLSSKNIFQTINNTRKTDNHESNVVPDGIKNIYRKNPLVMEKLKELLCFIDREIESHKKENGVMRYRDVIDIYLKSSSNSENNNSISRLSLDSTIIDFYTNGTQQMSSYLLWALYCMIEYPDVQNKCHDEIDEKIGQFRPVVNDDIKDLPYINATLLEVSRRFTVIPLSQPLILTKDMKLGPYELSKNTIIVCNYHAVHMNEKIWNEPLIFCPERFIKDNTLLTKTPCCQKLFNFGIDENSCRCPVSDISFQTVFVFFANLLQKFDFEKNRHANLSYRYRYNGVSQPFDFKMKVDSH